jgi:hypothetical protein
MTHTEPSTLRHLDSWIYHCIRREDQGPFLDYALKQLADSEPGLWEERGWNALYDQFLGIR